MSMVIGTRINEQLLNFNDGWLQSSFLVQLPAYILRAEKRFPSMIEPIKSSVNSIQMVQTAAEGKTQKKTDRIGKHVLSECMVVDENNNILNDTLGENKSEFLNESFDQSHSDELNCCECLRKAECAKSKGNTEAAAVLYKQLSDVAESEFAKGNFTAKQVGSIFFNQGLLKLRKFHEKKDLEDAGGYFKKALEYCPGDNQSMYNMLVCYCKAGLSKSVEDYINSHKCKISTEFLSCIYTELGISKMENVADPRVNSNEIKEALVFFEKAREYNNKNMWPRFWYARILAAKGEYEMLIETLNIEVDTCGPFSLVDIENFEIHYCKVIAAVMAGEFQKAFDEMEKLSSLNLRKTDLQELSSYVSCLKSGKIGDEEKKKLCGCLDTAIRRLCVEWRSGKIVDPENISFEKGVRIGYHGTTKTYLSELQKGVAEKAAPGRQFKGKGFYIAREKEIATYFANKKAREVGGKAIVLKVYANRSLVGQAVHARAKVKMGSQYDFVQAPIDGYDKYSQYYVFENSLDKLEIGNEHESVEWNDEEYERFIRSWNVMCQ